MEKTGKCYHFFICLSVLFGIIFAVVFLRVHSGFEYPSQNDLHNFLVNCQYSLLVGFVLATSITITLKCILDDLEWKLARLEIHTEDLNKKIKEMEKDK